MNYPAIPCPICKVAGGEPCRPVPPFAEARWVGQFHRKRVEDLEMEVFVSDVQKAILASLDGADSKIITQEMVQEGLARAMRKCLPAQIEIVSVEVDKATRVSTITLKVPRKLAEQLGLTVEG